MKTQVAIIGAGPSGLLLGHLLRQAGLDCVIVERQSADHVLSRIRAGVLESVTIELMQRLGLDRRMQAEGMIEGGFNLADGERLIRIDIAALTGKEEAIDVSQVDVSMNGIELQDREFVAAIREGREPNSSVAQVLPCYRVLDALDRQLETQRKGQ